MSLCFNSSYFSGLNGRSRDLLNKCRPCRIKIKRLQKNLVDCYKRIGQPTVLCIDQTDDVQSLAMQQTPSFINSVSDETWFEQCMLPRTEVNLGASSSFVAAGSNLWASTSNALFQDGCRGIQRQPDNCMQYAGSLGYDLTYRDRVPHGEGEKERPAVHQGSGKYLSHQSEGRWNQNVHFQEHRDADSIDRVHGSHSVLQDFSYVQTKSKKVSLRDEWHNSHSEVQVVKIYKNNESKYNSDSRIQNTNNPPATQTGVMQTVRPGVVSVPQLLENESDSLSLNNASVSISRTNTPIEIIDLSSDDDESMNSRRQNEADNAPQQLNGLNCYPHSGAKIPFSSKHSLPKNGNSHWSSEKESHCGAGHLGDLAINGQPPNVPPNLSISPVPDSVFLPYTAPPAIPNESGIKPNSRKRKHESLNVTDRKILILDSSSSNSKTEYEKIIKENVGIRQNSPFRLCTQEGFQDIHGEEAVVPEVLDGEYIFRRESLDQGSQRLIIDDEISFKPPLHVDEDISFNITERHLDIDRSGRQRNSSELEGVSKEMGLSKEANMNSQDKHVQCVGTPVVGFLSNIVNTVNKGVEFFRALVGSSINDKVLHAGDKQTLKCENISPTKGKVVESSNKYSITLTEEGSEKKTAVARKKCSEMDKLLKDECRELKQRGLGELRHLDIQEARLTRRSVERYIPRKTKRKAASGFKHYSIKGSPHSNKDLTEKSTQKVNISDSKIRTAFHRKETNDLSKSDPHSYEGEVSNVPTKVDFCIPLLEDKHLSKDADKNLFTDIAVPSELKDISAMNVDVLDDCIDENGNSPTYSGIRSAFDNNKNSSSARLEEVDHKQITGLNSRKHDLAFKNVNSKTIKTSEVCSYQEDTFIQETFMGKEKKWENEKIINTAKLRTPPVKTSRNLYKGARELLNLASDEWKEISKQGFHPLRIVKPALIKKVLQAESRENIHSTPRKLHMLVQDELETGQPTFTDSKSERVPQTDIHCAWSSHLNGNRPDVNVSYNEIDDSLMGETADTHGGFTEVPETGAHGKFLLSDAKLLNTHTNKACTESKEAAPSQKEFMDKNNLENSKSHSVKKSKTKPYRSRELLNLAGDEWKEMQGKGFHPSDLLGVYSGEFECCDCISGEEYTPKAESQHFIKETNNNSPEFSDLKQSPKLSRELFRLLKDECKELQPAKLRVQKSKSRSRKNLQPFGLKRLQEAYKSADISTRRQSLLQNLSLDSACRPSLGYHKMGNKTSGMTGTKSQQTRNTRSQTNILSNVEACTPRSSHREILQTELAMCVLNYDLPAIL